MPRTQVVKVDSVSPDRDVVCFAARLLQNGKLVAFPTETVYGIAANFYNQKAVDRLYEIKKRPPHKPFTIHISRVDTIRRMHCEISLFAEALIKNFWPGPLTIVLKCRFGRLGFRMPEGKIAEMLIEESKVPVVAPSANISGETPPTDIGGILRALDGKIDLILDGGPTKFKKESAVVDITTFPYKILRKGAISEEEISKIWKKISQE